MNTTIHPDKLLTLAQFRRLRDEHAVAWYRARLPEVERQLEALRPRYAVLAARLKAAHDHRVREFIESEIVALWVDITQWANERRLISEDMPRRLAALGEGE